MDQHTKWVLLLPDGLHLCWRRMLTGKGSTVQGGTDQQWL